MEFFSEIFSISLHGLHFPFFFQLRLLVFPPLVLLDFQRCLHWGRLGQALASSRKNEHCDEERGIQKRRSLKYLIGRQFLDPNLFVAVEAIEIIILNTRNRASLWRRLYRLPGRRAGAARVVISFHDAPDCVRFHVDLVYRKACRPMLESY